MNIECVNLESFKGKAPFGAKVLIFRGKIGMVAIEEFLTKEVIDLGPGWVKQKIEHHWVDERHDTSLNFTYWTEPGQFKANNFRWMTTQKFIKTAIAEAEKMSF